jgi:ABC-type sugar transport system ATPase subunit
VHHSFDDGGAYALLGPSGCGKTTLLNIISGLLHASHGQLLFDGKDVTGCRRRSATSPRYSSSRLSTTP